MLSPKVKKEVSEKVQAILQSIDDSELPDSEINFILHIDGAEGWSWANIRNGNRRNIPAPFNLIGNESALGGS